MRTLKRLGLLGVALGVLLAGCATSTSTSPSDSGAAPRPARTKRITAALLGEPAIPSDQYNPGRGTPGLEDLEELLNVALAHADVQGQLHPVLAEAVPTTENGLWKVFPDGRMELTWKIRPNAQWHDGAPFTAADIVFTAQVSQDRDLPIRVNPVWRSVEAVEAQDPHTVVIKWKRPFFLADHLMTTSFEYRTLPLPKHLLEALFNANKEGFQSLPYWTETFVGTGAYKLKEWVTGSHASLVANDNYLLGRPKIDEIVMKFIPDPNTMVANILAGEVDVLVGRGLSLDQALTIRDRWSEGRVDISLPSWTLMWVQHLTPNPPVVADLRFKRALMHALDRQALADAIMRGVSEVAHSTVHSSRPYYKAIEESVVRYEYDPSRAARMIQDLGYRKAPGGMFRDAGNQPLSVEVQAGAGLDIHEKLLFSIADYWQRVGVGVEPLLVPRQLDSDREFTNTFPGYKVQRQATEPDRLLRLHSSQMPLPETRFTGNNRSRYSNPQWDALLDRFAATVPKQEQLQVLAQIVHHMTDQLVNLPVFYDIQAAPISKRLTEATVIQGHVASMAWNVHLWDLK